MGYDRVDGERMIPGIVASVAASSGLSGSLLDDTYWSPSAQMEWTGTEWFYNDFGAGEQELTNIGLPAGGTASSVDITVNGGISGFPIAFDILVIDTGVTTIGSGTHTFTGSGQTHVFNITLTFGGNDIDVISLGYDVGESDEGWEVTEIFFNP